MAKNILQNVLIAMKNIKNTITIFIILATISSCSEKQDNFSTHDWILHYYEFNEDYSSSTSHQRILFKNDSIVCISKITGETTRFPLIKKDSLIIFKELYTIGGKGETKKDTIVTDTLLYDFKNIFNKPLLFIKPLNSEYFNVLTSSKDNIQIEESNNFLSITNFKIGGFEIGDSISIDSLNNVKDADNYGVKNLLIANPKNNDNIELEIIDKKYIYSIKQRNIEKSQTENIAKIINEKINIIPDTINQTQPFYLNGFQWSHNGIDIKLENNNMYQHYMDIVHETKGNGILSIARQTAALKLANESSEQSSYYELEYNNSILQEILRTISTRKTQSSIIE
ncbi:hypothetical protein [Dokdonia sp. Dokd-P16]|uniref:hypothetical protein n=1 Tax=Dokdonia sp. Dokd-P16 TaxID=2173169 RepID=UPI0013A55A95|nr:hypothetical protein [Dokdonia sp. Dokd-P16]